MKTNNNNPLQKLFDDIDAENAFLNRVKNGGFTDLGGVRTKIKLSSAIGANHARQIQLIGIGVKLKTLSTNVPNLEILKTLDNKPVKKLTGKK